MRPLLSLLAASLALGACAGAPPAPTRPEPGAAVQAPRSASGQAPSRMFRDGSSLDLLKRAEAKASPAGAKVLAAARVMTVDERSILPGACWDYVNAAWNRAGYTAKKRQTVFKGGKRTGPYAEAAQIQPGDWVYFINHSYGDIEHSALFVDWADVGAKSAYMLSYAGEKRAETARYLLYDLRSAYQVIRAKD